MAAAALVPDPDLDETEEERATHRRVLLAAADRSEEFITYDLAQAVERGWADVLERYLRGGADANMLVRAGTRAPLHFATKASVGRVLLAHGADARKMVLQGDIRAGKTPLHMAVEHAAMSMVRFLVEEAHVEVDIPDAQGCTPLFFSPSVALSEYLIRQGASARAVSLQGTTPLHAVARNKHPPIPRFELCCLLLEHGADVAARELHGASPLMGATDSPELCKLMVDRGADVSARTTVGWTALLSATFGPSSLEVCKLLVEHGADVNAGTKDAIPLSSAEDVATFEFLAFAPGVDVTATRKSTNALFWLNHCFRDGIDDPSTYNRVLEYLVARGVDCKATADLVRNGWHHTGTLMHGARTPEACVLLARQNPKMVNARSSEGRTPLHTSIANRRHQVTKALIDLGADVMARENGGTGQTPLHLARDARTARLLLETGRVDVNARVGHNGPTPLIRRSCRSDTPLGEDDQTVEEICQVLLEFGANPSIHDFSNSGNTALHVALRSGTIRMYELLLTSKETNVNAWNFKLETPLEYVLGLDKVLIHRCSRDPGIWDMKPRMYQDRGLNAFERVWAIAVTFGGGRLSRALKLALEHMSPSSPIPRLLRCVREVRAMLCILSARSVPRLQMQGRRAGAENELSVFQTWSCFPSRRREVKRTCWVHLLPGDVMRRLPEFLYPREGVCAEEEEE